MKKKLSFLYIDVVLPVLCLYAFGFIKSKLEAYTRDTFDPIPSLVGRTAIYITLGILLAVLVQVCVKEAGEMSTIVMLTIGIVIALLCAPVCCALGIWVFGFYQSFSFGLIYVGACVYLDIYCLYCRRKQCAAGES